MIEVAVIGTYFGGKMVSDGQSVKTKILTEELERVFGSDQVLRIDTIGWKKNPIKLFTKSILAVQKCKNVVFMTDENGTKVFPLLLRLANVSGKCKLHYYVIGGWLSNYLDRSKTAIKNLKKLDAIYVEVPAMQRELEMRGFINVVLVNKFRRINLIRETEIELAPKPPFKLCFFSRVMKEKGFEDAVSAVKLANEKTGFIKYTLDIFGAVNQDYQDRFEKVMQAVPDYIKYKGIVDFQKSGSILKDYFALLFPTFYTSEGYPNAMVDAFAAGLPIIATRWNYNADIIHDYQDGILVDVGSVDQIVSALEYLAENKANYANMRLNCLRRCKEYSPEHAIERVTEKMK